MTLDAADLWKRGRRRRTMSRAAGPVLAVVAVLVGALVLVPSGSGHKAAPSVVQPGPTQPAPALPTDCSEGLGAPLDPSGLTAVQFVSASTGYVVGLDRIVATTDGGSHWTVQLQQDGLHLREVDFVDASHGWALGGLRLWHTSDGGTHWAATDQPCLGSVHFHTTTHGYGTDLQGHLLRTTDAGTTWTRVASPTKPTAVCFSNDSDGLLAAFGGIYRTTDGARTWARQLEPQQSLPVVELSCAGPGAGWAVLHARTPSKGQQAHEAFRSDGTTWSPVYVSSAPGVAISTKTSLPAGPAEQFGGLSAVDPDTAAFVDSCSTCGQGLSYLTVSTDKGIDLSAGYHSRPVAGIATAGGASFLSTTEGWVVGSTPEDPTVNRIVHTTDGGVTWTTQYATETAAQPRVPRCPTDARSQSAPCGTVTYLDTDVDSDGIADHVQLDESGLWVRTATRFLFTDQVRSTGGSLRLAGVSDLARDGHTEILLADSAAGCCGYRATEAVFDLWRIGDASLVHQSAPQDAFRDNHGRGDVYAGFACQGKGVVEQYTGHLEGQGPSGIVWSATRLTLSGDTWSGAPDPASGHNLSGADAALLADVSGCSGLGKDGYVPSVSSIDSLPDCYVGQTACATGAYAIATVDGKPVLVEAARNSDDRLQVTLTGATGRIPAEGATHPDASTRLAGVTQMFGHTVALVASGTVVPGHYDLTDATFSVWQLDGQVRELPVPSQVPLRTSATTGFSCVDDQVDVRLGGRSSGGTTMWTPTRLRLGPDGLPAFWPIPLGGSEGTGDQLTQVTGCPGIGPDGFATTSQG